MGGGGRGVHHVQKYHRVLEGANQEDQEGAGVPGTCTLYVPIGWINRGKGGRGLFSMSRICQEIPLGMGGGLGARYVPAPRVDLQG